MKIRCKICGEFFTPDEETKELVSEGFITFDSVSTCDGCYDMLNHLFDEAEEFYSDADPSL